MRKPKRLEGQAFTETVVRLPDPTQLETGELAKSTKTRQRIMEAAIDCLAQEGYAKTSTSAVARRAKLTRTAMLYHFPSRMQLIESVIYYVIRKRNTLYYEAVREIPPGRVSRADRIDSVWEQLQTNVFRAFTELLVASRTDLDLAAVFGPALAEYDRARRENALKTFSDEEIQAPWFDLRRDIVRFLLEGFAQQGGLSYNVERRTAHILSFLKTLVADPAGDQLMLAAMARAEGRSPPEPTKLSGGRVRKAKAPAARAGAEASPRARKARAGST